MSTLILDTPDYQLSLQQDLLHIAHPEQKPRLYPLTAVDRIILGKGITLTTDLQIKLSESGKNVVFLGHKSCTTLFNPCSTPNGLRLQQYQAIQDTAIKSTLTMLLLQARRRGQNRVLHRLEQTSLPPFPDIPINFMQAEAVMSHYYWQAWARCFHSSGFTGRMRRPPTDPINALLSLSSTLEDQVLMAPLLAEGFDVTLGLHHVTGYQRPSLVLDIKELTRADVEWWVLTLWKRKILLPEHFSQNDSGCRLTKEGQQHFYTAWHRWQKRRKVSLRRMVKLSRHLLQRTLNSEGYTQEARE